MLLILTWTATRFYFYMFELEGLYSTKHTTFIWGGPGVMGRARFICRSGFGICRRYILMFFECMPRIRTVSSVRVPWLCAPCGKQSRIIGIFPSAYPDSRSGDETCPTMGKCCTAATLVAIVLRVTWLLRHGHCSECHGWSQAACCGSGGHLCSLLWVVSGAWWARCTSRSQKMSSLPKF